MARDRNVEGIPDNIKAAAKIDKEIAQKLKMKMITLRMSPMSVELAEFSIKFRCLFGNYTSQESFSGYMRNLILEDYNRNQRILEENTKNTPAKNSKRKRRTKLEMEIEEEDKLQHSKT